MSCRNHHNPKTRSDILQGQALFTRVKQKLLFDFWNTDRQAEMTDRQEGHTHRKDRPTEKRDRQTQ